MINTLIAVLLVAAPAWARHTPGIEKFSIFGKAEQLPTKPGAAHLIDEKELEKFNYRDVHQILRSVPGVNIQEEEGLGLRPNIGLRGAHPHRSKKVTLMEDGVLIAPAPYSAPAAYYFPAMEKIYNFEIYKGPAAVQFGPNSVGGALNMITRRHQPGAIVDLAYGQFNFQKLHTAIGFTGFGEWSVDLLGARHDGFKFFDNFDQTTGYQRYNYLLRWDHEFSGQQQVTIKLNWADEDSDETYLGLTNDDFNLRPFNRYAASERDKMVWNHRQLFVNYNIEPSDRLVFSATAYLHILTRNWEKFDGFRDLAISPTEVLRKPYLSANNYYYNILRGQQDSVAADQSDSLRITDNGRQFLSRGVQLLTKTNFETGRLGYHDVQLGYRLHGDQIARNHVSEFYEMTSGRLQSAALAAETIEQNKHQALAHTLFLNDTLSAGPADISLGVRLENVSYETFDYLTGASSETSTAALNPGIGAFFQLYSKGGLLMGVNKGVTLVGPGQVGVVNESAINYEFGFRHSGAMGIEAVAFYSDYQNILGTCTVSSGCSPTSLDQQLNGGAAEVYGLEGLVSGTAHWGPVQFPTRLSGTLTNAYFKNSFTSELAEWGLGEVPAGAPMPYIPQVQGQLATGIEFKKFSGFINLNYVGQTFDQAAAVDRLKVPAYYFVNTSFQYLFSQQLRLMLRADNILNQRYVVSLRPFGARPGQPFSAYVGIRYDI